MKTILSYCITLFCCTLTCSLHAQYYLYDDDFGGNLRGITLDDWGTTSDQAAVMALQPDQKILVAGKISRSDHQISTTDFALARYTSNGQADNTFGDEHLVTTDFDGEFDEARALLLLSNGRILLGGTMTTPGIEQNIALVCYESDGKLREEFGVGGKLSIDLGGDGQETITQFYLLPSGNILAGAIVEQNGQLLFYLLQLRSDGSLVENFGNQGRVRLDFPGQELNLGNINLSAEGKILIGATSIVDPASGSDLALLRLNSDGSVDESFGEMGGVHYDGLGDADYLRRVRLLADGTILLAGLRTNDLSGEDLERDIILVRLQANGELDLSFEPDGKKLITHSFFWYDCKDMFVGTDGLITIISTAEVSGFSTFPSRFTNFTILQPNEAKSSGYSLTQINGNYFEDFVSLAQQSDGKYLGLGNIFTSPTLGQDIVLTRFIADPVSIIPPPPPISQMLTFAVDPNPLHDTGKLRFNLPQDQEIRVELYDLNGRLISLLVSPIVRLAGFNEITFELPSGIVSGSYIVRFTAEDEIKNVKIVYHGPN